jgi:hypothetical protein
MTDHHTTPRNAGVRSYDRMTQATVMIIDLYERSRENPEVVRPPPINPN